MGAKGVEWAKWHIFFGDERNVPHSSGDSTIKGAREAFLGRVPIPAAQVHAIAEGLSVEVGFGGLRFGPAAFHVYLGSRLAVRSWRQWPRLPSPDLTPALPCGLTLRHR